MSRLSTRDSVSESVQEKVEPQSPRKGEISHSFVMDETMGCNENEKFSFSFFSNFSFLGEKWETRNEKLTFFNFNQNFPKFLPFFNDFSKSQNIFSISTYIRQVIM